jgi:hypothetical protein
MSAELNPCARLWCQTRDSPAPTSIPHTVRRAGWATIRATNAVNVRNDGSVKHHRNVHNNLAQRSG